ncbi:unnamed protein product, partial [Hapterophycus canaliculatus]
ALQVSRLEEEPHDGDGDDHADGSSSSNNTALIHRLKLAAPVLSMDFCPASAPIFGGGGGGSRGLLLAGGMDGGSHLVSIDVGSSSGGGGGGTDADSFGGEAGGGGERERKNGVALLASMKDHAKYVVVCR